VAYANSVVSENIAIIHNTTQEVDKRLQNQSEQAQTARITKWLAPSDPSTNYLEALKQRQKDTGLWFVHGEAFKQWKQQPNSFLWLHGIPGCGKTVLSSTIIEHLKQDVACPLLLYYYFDFNDEKKQSLDSVLRSLGKQLYQEQTNARSHLDQLWTSHGEGSQQPSTSSLQRVLQAMLSGAQSVSIILDALDESKSREELLAWLKTLVKGNHSECQLLVTARREEDIESALWRWTRSEERIPIQQSDVDVDIRAYVHTEVHHGEVLRRWRSRPDLQEEIETKLMEKANGM
jgi:Cdc6-like AAA superfamily ATPase